jgi:hypothetical protein
VLQQTWEVRCLLGIMFSSPLALYSVVEWLNPMVAIFLVFLRSLNFPIMSILVCLPSSSVGVHFSPHLSRHLLSDIFVGDSCFNGVEMTPHFEFCFVFP